MPELSAYEQKCLATRAENDAELRRLGLGTPTEARPRVVRRSRPVHPEYLTYGGLMHKPTYSALRQRFLDLLPFCAWRHLSETPTCLPVPCCKTTSILNQSVVQFFTLKPTDDASLCEVEPVAFADYTRIGQTPIVGFVFLSNHAVKQTSQRQHFKSIVYSGATTTDVHARMLLDVIAQYKLSNVWLHYDVFLFESLRRLNEADVASEPSRFDVTTHMRFTCAGQTRPQQDIYLQTSFSQEFANLQAIHRQLAVSFDMPTPKRIVAENMGVNDQPARDAFKAPQYVRPVVKRNTQGKLCAHYVNVQPIGDVDVRIASPSARASCSATAASADCCEATVMDPYVYTPNSAGAANLFNGDVILALLDCDTTGARRLPTVWASFETPDPLPPKPGAEHRVVKLVDETALAHKVVGAYAKRLADVGACRSPSAKGQCQMQCDDICPSASAWSAQDHLEDLLWKQRVGAVGDRPPVDESNPKRYVVGVPNTHHFYRVLWYREGDAIYLLPFHNYLVLRDYMGSCVPLHGHAKFLLHGHAKEIDNCEGFKFIKFVAADDRALFAKLEAMMPDEPFNASAVDLHPDDVRRIPMVSTHAQLVYGVRFENQEEFFNKIPEFGWFSCGQKHGLEREKLRGFDNAMDALAICEKHIRHLFMLQMRRFLRDEHGVSSRSIDGFLSNFDEDACWPAIDTYTNTFYAYVKCNHWPFRSPLPDAERVSFAANGAVAVADEFITMVADNIERKPVLTNMSAADCTAFRAMAIENNAIKGDCLQLQVGEEDNNLYIAFSPCHTAHSVVSFEEDNPKSTMTTGGSILTRRDSQRDGPYTWPLNYYANGSIFFNNTSNINNFRQNPSYGTLAEAIPNLRILRGMYCQKEPWVDLETLPEKTQTALEGGPQEASSFFEVMCELIDDTMKTKLAFNIGRNDKRSSMFVLEVYDASRSLCSAAVVTDLADSVANANIKDMRINALELVAAFGGDDTAALKHFEVDDALKLLGCSDCYKHDDFEAIRHVLTDCCRFRGVDCLAKTKMDDATCSSGIRFWGSPYFADPSYPFTADVVLADNEGLCMYNKKGHSKIPDSDDAEYCLFATPRCASRPSGPAPTIAVDPPAKRIGEGVFRLHSMVLRDGVCDLRFESGEVVTVERTPSFASLRDTSIDVARTPRLDPCVVDHGPPEMRSATDKGEVRTANLVLHHDRRRICRVRLEAADDIFAYLRESPAHLVVLTGGGVTRTSTTSLAAHARASASTTALLVEAVAHNLSGGVFPAHTPLDRRIVFGAKKTSAADAPIDEVCGVALLHITTGGVVRDADRLRAITRHPGSYICADGPTMVYGSEAAPPSVAYDRAFADLVYHNCIVGDAWVLSSIVERPTSLHATTVHSAVDGRCWNGTDSVAWNARMILIHDNGDVSWNSGFTPHLTRGPIQPDAAVVHHGDLETFALLTPPTTLAADLPVFGGTSEDSTVVHTRAVVDEPFSLRDDTERLSVLVTPQHNATLFVYALLPSSTRSDVLLGHDIGLAARRALTGVDAFTVTVTTTLLTPMQTRDDDLTRLVQPLVLERASERLLAPGGGPQCLVEVRIGASIDDDAASARFRQACVATVQDVLGIDSVASRIFNAYEAYAVTLLNRRVEHTLHRGVVGASDVGRRIRVQGGTLHIDDKFRPAKWSWTPPDVVGIVEGVQLDTDATVVVRVHGRHTITLPNPALVHRAHPDTLARFYASAMRVALEHYRPEP